MKNMQYWTVLTGLFLSVLALGGYAYNISAYAATLETNQKGQQRQLDDYKEDLKYLRQRTDDIYNILRQQSCGQCKDH